MHYDGTLKDGTKFDSSYDRGQPLPLRIGRGQVIKCWDEVGVQMNVGQKVRVLCPSDTAYGSRAIGPIPANSDLVFIIERVKWYKYSFIKLHSGSNKLNKGKESKIKKYFIFIFLRFFNIKTH